MTQPMAQARHARSRAAWLFIGVIAGLGAALSSVPALAAEELVLLYINRPPLSYTDADGHARGTLVEIADRVMAQTGVVVRWEESSARRILHAVASEGSTVCSPGWYQTDERRKYALFSDRIYSEGSPVVIVNNDALSKVRATARETLMQGATLLRKDGFVFIPYLQKLVDGMPPEHVVFTDRDTKDLPAMIGAQHGEIAFLPHSEAEYWLEIAPVKNITIVHFSDLPAQGEPRYIMCGRATPSALLTRINHAIATLPAELRDPSLKAVPLPGAPPTQ